MPRGQVILQAWEARIVAEREAVHVTAACLWCDWTQAGTVLETRTAHEQHRSEHHPEHHVRKRAQRKRPYSQLTGGRDLTDNIAKARETGAATWVNT